MGGMHAWMWAEMYPDLMDRVVPISCQPIEISGCNWISRRAAADALYEQRLAQAAQGDANDALWAIEAIMDYDPEPDLDKITARVLLINAEEDEANPPELGTVERAMKRVRHGRYVLIPASEKTHGHFTHFYSAVWKPYLIEFMKTLDGPPAAGADDAGTD